MNKCSTIQQRLRATLVATGIASALVLAGCGSDDAADTATDATAAPTRDTTTADTTTADTATADTATADTATADTTAATTAGTTAGDGDAAGLQTVCDNVVRLDQTVPTGTATKDEANALLDDAIAAADEETATMLTGFQEALQPMLDDPEGEPSEAFFGQYSAVLGWVGANCDVQSIDVHAEEYHFMGVPDEIEAGYYIVNFVNDGNEAHELGVVRINDDVTMTVEELLALPEEEADTMVEFVGGMFAPPGGTTVGSLTLTDPGRFAAVCFVPTGTTADAEGSGPPHAMQGMVQEVTVS